MGKSFTISYEGEKRNLSFKKAATDPLTFDVEVEDSLLASIFGSGIIYLNGVAHPTKGTMPLNELEIKLLKDIYQKILELDN